MENQLQLAKQYEQHQESVTNSELEVLEKKYAAENTELKEKCEALQNELFALKEWHQPCDTVIQTLKNEKSEAEMSAGNNTKELDGKNRKQRNS